MKEMNPHLGLRRVSLLTEKSCTGKDAGTAFKLWVNLCSFQGKTIMDAKNESCIAYSFITYP